MVTAPFSYIGLVIALILVVTVFGSVWVLIDKLVRLPMKQVEKQRVLPVTADNLDEKQLENQ